MVHFQAKMWNHSGIDSEIRIDQHWCACHGVYHLLTEVQIRHEAILLLAASHHKLNSYLKTYLKCSHDHLALGC